MKVSKYILIGLVFPFFACTTAPKENTISLYGSLLDLPSMKGTKEYIKSPYVTAGDRVYAVGHQDGSFPDFGWHVRGEMAGIWNHPIKLMDGFTISISESGSDSKHCLNAADTFTNYPIANTMAYSFPEVGLEVQRTQFVPDGLEGMVVELVINNTAKTSKTIDLAFTAMIDLLPVWISDSIGIYDAKDTLRFEQGKIIGKDTKNPWFVIIGNDIESTTFDQNNTCPQERKGTGVDGTLQNKVTIQANEQIIARYFIAGSYISEASAEDTYQKISKDPLALLNAKWTRYSKFSNYAKIDVPDPKIMEMYQWMLYNSDWLVRDVPEIGRGMSAGIPDFPWWFGADNCYTLQALLAIGWHEEVKSTLDLIIKISKSVNDNGRVMHEASTNGVVFNPGNLNETPHFIYLMWQYYLWTGDQAFIEQNYAWVQKGLQWIMEQDKDGNLYPDGPGMMEIHGLHSEMIDVVVYTQQAMEAGAAMAILTNDQQNAVMYQKTADELRKKINDEWWVATDSSFADFRSSQTEALELVKAAIIRADTINKPTAKATLELKLAQLKNLTQKGVNSHVVHHNWVVNTPMEMKIADDEKASKALKTANQYKNRFGTYVTGMDKDENAVSTEKWKTFSYVGAVMTLPTGVQAVAEANYGNIDQSLEYIHHLYNSFNYALPGSMYEVSPDYGQMVQAWSIYGVAVPLVSHFFGIKPHAASKTIRVEPNFPSAWTNASIENVRIGNDFISLSMHKSSDTTHLTFTKTNIDLVIDVNYTTEGVLVVNGEIITSGTRKTL